MSSLFTQLAHDERGFIVSAELVLVTTIVVLGMVVGLAEISSSVNQELEDVASAFGSVNQSFEYRSPHSDKACTTGSRFVDGADWCDDDCDVGLADPRSER